MVDRMTGAWLIIGIPVLSTLLAVIAGTVRIEWPNISRAAWLRVAGIAAAVAYAVGVWVYSSLV